MYNILKSIIKNRLGIVPKPSFATFFVTWKCNCRCIMCDIWKKKEEDEMTPPEIKEIFSQLKLDAVRISGGEPFLRNDLHEIINIIEREANPKVIHITTNGILTRPILRTIRKIRKKEKIHLKISIDDIGKKHDLIRGVPAFVKARATARRIREEFPQIVLGINQTIVDESGLSAYKSLKKIFRGIDIFPVLAYNQATSLYSNGETSPDNSYTPFGNFEGKKLSTFIKNLIRDSGDIKDFRERMIKRYYLRGLYNRLILGKIRPNPKCVALTSHIRILPNGDVPICMYNSTATGNLRKERLDDLWLGQGIEKHRKWVRSCKGCWAGCESNVNAIYSGDIWRGL